ncbi:hypothetical protein JXA34_00505 [Patescibacteria group bacterium]|nr:hypothetical protein [Patescibacteria group bacterium]
MNLLYLGLLLAGMFVYFGFSYRSVSGKIFSVWHGFVFLSGLVISALFSAGLTGFIKNMPGDSRVHLILSALGGVIFYLQTLSFIFESMAGVRAKNPKGDSIQKIPYYIFLRNSPIYFGIFLVLAISLIIATFFDMGILGKYIQVAMLGCLSGFSLALLFGCPLVSLLMVRGKK